MEPRTATSINRLKVVETLNATGIPCGVMTAPIIPGLNSHEIPSLIEKAAQAGAVGAGYTMVRLNGAVGAIFTDWIKKTFPDKAEKVLHQIADVHGGQLNDSRFGVRMRGEGKIAESIKQLFKSSVKRHLAGRSFPEYDYSLFNRDAGKAQMSLF
jgi:DNA repair photolyase